MIDKLIINTAEKWIEERIQKEIEDHVTDNRIEAIKKLKLYYSDTFSLFNNLYEETMDIYADLNEEKVISLEHDIRNPLARKICQLLKSMEK